MGQKPIPATPINAPMPTSTTVAGAARGIKANDARKARIKTRGAVQRSFSRTNVMLVSAVVIHPSPALTGSEARSGGPALRQINANLQSRGSNQVTGRANAAGLGAKMNAAHQSDGHVD